MRSLVLLVLLVPAGCFTTRVAVGPDVASSGRGGVTATAGYGFGYGFGDHQAVYLSAGGGIVGDGYARALLADSVDYVDYAARWPVRYSARFGALFGRDRFAVGDRALFGLGVAFFPWHDRAGGGGGETSEKSVDLLPAMVGYRAVGVELAVDAMPGTGASAHAPAERSALMITCALVAEFDGMLDR